MTGLERSERGIFKRSFRKEVPPLRSLRSLRSGRQTLPTERSDLVIPTERSERRDLKEGTL